MAELGVRGRAVRDRATSSRDDLNVIRIHPHAVDEKRPTIERAALLEQRDRRSRATRNGDASTLPAIRKLSSASNDEIELRPDSFYMKLTGETAEQFSRNQRRQPRMPEISRFYSTSKSMNGH